MKKERKRTELTKYLILFLAAVIILVGSTTFVIYQSEVSKEKAILATNELDNVNFQAKIIVNNFGSIVSDLKILSEGKELISYLDGEEVSPQKTAEVFLSFSNRKRIYNQIRFIDESGMEVVRVNYQDGDSIIVPENELQFKGDRYYYRDTFQLEREEVFVSPFDLNIEFGEIERPLKPIIRFGTPVYDSSGNKRGIVVLNYLGANLLDSLRDASANTPGEIMLLNGDGYWLMGPNSEDDWGFMFEDRRDKTFGNAFPEEWLRITSIESGQFHTQDGVYTYETIHPLSDVLRAGKEPFRTLDTSMGRLQDGELWKIVSFLPQETLTSGPQRTLGKIIIIDFIVIILNILLFIYYTR
jgi:hypothetical protein